MVARGVHSCGRDVAVHGAVIRVVGERDRRRICVRAGRATQEIIVTLSPHQERSQLGIRTRGDEHRAGAPRTVNRKNRVELGRRLDCHSARGGGARIGKARARVVAVRRVERVPTHVGRSLRNGKTPGRRDGLHLSNRARSRRARQPLAKRQTHRPRQPSNAIDAGHGTCAPVERRDARRDGARAAGIGPRRRRTRVRRTPNQRRH